MKAERWIWIGGWGLPADWLREQAERNLPSATHSVVTPGPAAISDIDWSRFDRVGGYSFGAFLLLKHAKETPRPAVLLAPFFAYPAEAAIGGKIRQTQLRVLLRWLEREPEAALTDFYQRADLGMPPARELPYSIDDLTWGLHQLSGERAPVGLPDGWTGVIGDHDPLLDAGTLHQLEPGLRVIPGTGHQPGPLLRSLFEE